MYTYTNQSDIEQLNYFIVVNILNSIVTILLSLGYNSYFIKRSSQIDFKPVAETSQYLTFSIVNLIFSVFISAGFLYFMYGYSLDYLPLAILYWSGTFILQILIFILRSKHFFSQIGYYQLATALLKIIIFFCVYQIYKFSIMWAHFLSIYTTALVFIFLNMSRIRKYKLVKLNLRSVWKESKFLYFEGFVNYSTKELDTLLVSVLAKPDFLITFYLLKRVEKIFQVFYSTIEKQKLSFSLRNDPFKSENKYVNLIFLGSVISFLILVIYGPEYVDKLEVKWVYYFPFLIVGLYLSYWIYIRSKIVAFVKHGSRERFLVSVKYLVCGYSVMLALSILFGQKALFTFSIFGSLSYHLVFNRGKVLLESSINRSSIVAVVGMHKSGTTAVARLLHENGIRFIDIDDARTYEEGNKFERLEVQIANVLLMDVSLSYPSFELWRGNISKVVNSARGERVVHYVKKVYNNLGPNVGIKDPKLVYTLAFIKENVDVDFETIMVFRSPFSLWQHYSRAGKIVGLVRGIKGLRTWFEMNSVLLDYKHVVIIDFDLLRTDEFYRQTILSSLNLVKVDSFNPPIRTLKVRRRLYSMVVLVFKMLGKDVKALHVRLQREARFSNK